jgi:hypothetical protein
MLLHHTYILEERDIDIEEAFFYKKNSFFEERFRLLEKKSSNHLLFRYLLTGRIGYIKVIIKKEGNNLIIEPFQSVLGFLVPIVSFIASLVFFLLEDSTIAISMFGFGCFWLFLIFIFFQSDSKRIKELVLKSYSLSQ